MSGIKQFIDGVQDSWGVRPTVPFGTVIQIGDVGRISDDGAWVPVSSTGRRLGVEPSDLRTQDHADTIWDLTSGRDVRFAIFGEGATSRLVSNIADARARAEISFGSSRSFVFAAQNVTITSASEVTDVLAAIRRAYHERASLPQDQQWDKELAYVFAVADAEHFTSLIARSADTEVVVTAKGSVGPPSSAADLAFGVSVGISSNELQKATLAPAPRAFYRAYKLQPSIFRKWEEERQVVLHGVEPAPAGPPLEVLDRLPLDSPEEAFVGLDDAPFEVPRYRSTSTEG
jgi:hypothetical protein